MGSAGIDIVYRRFPMLADNPKLPASEGPEAVDKSAERPLADRPSRTFLHLPLTLLPGRLRLRMVAEARNWLAFVRAPVFFSSLAISLLYLTVLS